MKNASSRSTKTARATTPARAPYERPVVVELDLGVGTDGKYSAVPGEGGTQIGPS